MCMKFSVIVVCYNAGNKLRETVDSILEQTCGNYEILIKDGLSTDNSTANLPNSDKIQLYSCKDAGIYDAMNQAITRASGDYYIFLNCGDSFYHNDVLQKTTEIIAQQEETCKDKSKIYYGDTYDEVAQNIVSMNETITPFTCFRHIPCHQACFYPKELFAKRKYDLKYVIRADYEHFLWSYFKEKANPYHLGIVVANYEGGGFSETKENQRKDREEHKKITERYMSKKQLLEYRVFMALTLVPVRRFLSRQRYFSGIYNGVKKLFYRS